MKALLISCLLFLTGPDQFPGPVTGKNPAAIAERTYHKVLLIKWKPGVKGDEIKELLAVWSKMTQKIKGFESAEFTSLEPGEFDIAIELTFHSETAHQAYLDHPDHQELKNKAPGFIQKFAEYIFYKNKP